jgi:hypothetical protein
LEVRASLAKVLDMKRALRYGRLRTRKNRYVMNHTHLHALNDWCKGTGLLYPWVRFYSDEAKWAVSVVSPARGQQHPLRTMHGTDLEAVCAEILPKAQELFQQQKTSLERAAKEAEKRNKSSYRRITRDIEAMHHSASDF